MRKSFLAAFVVVAAAGCNPDSPYATWETGLHVKGKITKVAVATQWKSVQGQNVVESSGTIASGNFAGFSKGTQKVTTTTVGDLDWQVVGQAWTANQALPGRNLDEEFGWEQAPVALIESVETTTATAVTETTTVSEVQNQRHVLFESTTQAPRVQTVASTLGFTGEEWIVAILDLSALWNTNLPEDTAAGAPEAPTGALTADQAQVLVKADVAVGDTWVSPDGQTLYKAVDRETVNLGNRSVSAVKVELRRVYPAGADHLVDACLTIATDQQSRWTWEGPQGTNEGDFTSDTAHLNDGCGAKLRHGSEGFQWWFDNVLVKEDVTVWTTEIKDYGFEWVTGSGAGQARQTAKTLANDNSRPFNAVLFVESVRTETRRTYDTSLYQDAETPWQD